LPLIKQLIRVLAVDTDLWADPVWVVDSTPVECARSRPTVTRSNLAGWAGYSYCASHSRFFWGLRRHLIATPARLPITWALADPKIDERQVLIAALDHDHTLRVARYRAWRGVCGPAQLHGDPTNLRKSIRTLVVRWP